MAANEWKPDFCEKPILASKKFHIWQKERAYEIIKNKIYLDTNLSGNNIWRISQILLKEFSIPADKIMVHIKEYDNSIYF